MPLAFACFKLKNGQRGALAYAEAKPSEGGRGARLRKLNTPLPARAPLSLPREPPSPSRGEGMWGEAGETNEFREPNHLPLPISAGRATRREAHPLRARRQRARRARA